MNKSREITKIIEEIELLLDNSHKIPFSDISLVNHKHLKGGLGKLNNALLEYERLYNLDLSLDYESDLNNQSNNLDLSGAQAKRLSSENTTKDCEKLQNTVMENFELLRYQYQEDLDKKFSDMQETLTQYIDDILRNVKERKNEGNQKNTRPQYAYSGASYADGGVYDNPDNSYSSLLETEDKDFAFNNNEHNEGFDKNSYGADNFMEKPRKEKIGVNKHKLIDNTNASSELNDTTEDRMLNFINTEFLK